MSAKASGRVWDLDLPHNKRLVLLAMADHADHEGRNIYPSTDLIAWKTGYSSRQVQRVIDTLITDGILVVVAPARQQKPVTYALDFDAGTIKAPFPRAEHVQRRQNVTPQRRQNVTPEQSRGDISAHPGVTFQPSRGDIAMSPEPWNHDHEPPPPTQVLQKSGSGGGGDSYETEVRALLGGYNIQAAAHVATKYAALDTRPPLDVIRAAVLSMAGEQPNRIYRRLMNSPPPWPELRARAVAAPPPPPAPVAGLTPEQLRGLKDKHDYTRRS